MWLWVSLITSSMNMDFAFSTSTSAARRVVTGPPSSYMDWCGHAGIPSRVSAQARCVSAVSATATTSQDQMNVSFLLLLHAFLIAASAVVYAAVWGGPADQSSPQVETKEFPRDLSFSDIQRELTSWCSVNVVCYTETTGVFVVIRGQPVTLRSFNKNPSWTYITSLEGNS